MSKYIPHAAVARETIMQQARKTHGLKTGEYIKYPNEEAKDYFVVKVSQLTDEKRADMDRYLAMVALHKSESVAPEETEQK